MLHLLHVVLHRSYTYKLARTVEHMRGEKFTEINHTLIEGSGLLECGRCAELCEQRAEVCCLRKVLLKRLLQKQTMNNQAKKKN